jgi:glycosyltransferase involved in cell wall biosynthesis
MISAIIPMYNSEKTIINALNSVKVQTLGVGEFEIIVINDGSTDKSQSLVEDYIKKNPEMNFQLLNQENKGVSNARNSGLKIAKGEYIALLDADDEWLSEKTEKQLRYFENKNLNIDFLATKGNDKEILYPYKIGRNNLGEITFRKLLIRNEILAPTVMFKRKVFENTGFFDENQKHAEDVNYWMRVSLNNKMYILNESLVFVGGGKRTFGVSGLSANLSAMEKGFKKNLKEMYMLKNINSVQYLLLRLFYKAKYLLLLCRQFYYNLNTKKS